jgi:hypothetical protein
MKSSLHIPLFHAAFHLLYITFTITLTSSLTLLRLFNKILNRKNESLNPFKYTHPDVFKS